MRKTEVRHTNWMLVTADRLDSVNLSLSFQWPVISRVSVPLPRFGWLEIIGGFFVLKLSEELLSQYFEHGVCLFCYGGQTEFEL